MKKEQFFALAKENNIEVSELNTSKTTELSFSVFNSELDSFTISDASRFSARGIINGKFGVATSNKDDKFLANFLVNEILDTAKLVECEDKAIIFKGSEHYTKRNIFNKELSSFPVSKKIDFCFELERLIKAEDSRITEVEISYSENTSVSTIDNSYGLSLKDKSNYFVVFASVTVRENEEVRTAYKYIISNNIADFDVQKLAKETAKEGLNKLHAVQCETGKYKVVLNPQSTAHLLDAFVSNLSSEEVQKKTTLLADKLDSQIASKLITIKETPVDKGIFFISHDDEGVATYNKEIIKQGVLKTYLYSLSTADKDGVKSTGNGYGLSKVHVDTRCLTLQGGRLSREQLFEKVENGIFIEELIGLHAGLDSKSGDFSLQTQGHMIRDGKLAESVSLITVSGNLFKLFNEVKAVGNDSETLLNSTTSPSIFVKELLISGK